MKSRGGLCCCAASILLLISVNALAVQANNFLPYRMLVIPGNGNPGTGTANAFFSGLNDASSVNAYYLDPSWTFAGDGSAKLANALHLSKSDSPSKKNAGMDIIYTPGTINYATINKEYGPQGTTAQMCLPLKNGTSFVPGEMQCNLNLTASSGTPLTLPVIVTDGSQAIQTKMINALLANENTGSTTNPLVISRSVSGTPIDLSQFFYVPQNTNGGSVTYTLDPSKVCPVDGNCPTGQLFKLNTLGTKPTAVPGSITGKQLTVPSDAGLYQADIKVDYKYSKDGQNYDGSAYQTFYIKVGKVNPYFNHKLAMLYTYASGKYTYAAEVKRYASDVSSINSSLLNGNNSINEIIGAGTQLQYTNSKCQAGYKSVGPKICSWATSQASTPYNNQIATAGVNVGLIGQDQQSIAAYSDAFSTQSAVNLDVDFEKSSNTYTPAGKSLSAETPSMNEQQYNYMAAETVKEISQYSNFNAVSTDYESSFYGPKQVNYFVKNLADRLAYVGKYLNVYDFADRAFDPETVVAMGPVGVGLFSTYDASDNRTPNKNDNTSYNTSIYGISLSNQGLTTGERNFYETLLFNDKNCDFVQGSNGLKRNSNGCTETPYSAASENYRRWTAASQNTTAGKVSPLTLFKDMGGHYAPVLAIGASDSQSPYIVHAGNPNVAATNYLSPPASGAMSAVLSKGCKNPTTLSGLEQCLGVTNQLTTTMGSDKIPFQIFASCPTDTSSFSQCLMTSGPVSFFNDNQTADTDTQVNQGYMVPSVPMFLNKSAHQYLYEKDSTTINPNMVGVALFALEDIDSEGGHGCDNMGSNDAQNTRCYEPWYVGLNSQYNDAFYQEYEQSPSHQAAITPLVNVSDIWRTVNNILSTLKGASASTAWPEISWTHRGLPVTPINLSSNGDGSNNGTGTVSLNATITKAGSSTNDPVSYHCYVLSHGVPQGTCSISSAAKNNITVSNVGPLAYAAMVIANGPEGSNTITKKSVYIPLNTSSSATKPQPLLTFGYSALHIPIRTSDTSTTATAEFNNAYVVNAPAGDSPTINYSCWTGQPGTKLVEGQNCSISGNTVNVTNLPTSKDAKMPWLQVQATTSVGSTELKRGSQIQAIPINTHGYVEGLTWSPGSLHTFTPNEKGSFTATFMGPSYNGDSTFQGKPNVGISCLINGKINRNMCNVTGGQPTYKKTHEGTVTITGLNKGQSVVVGLVAATRERNTTPTRSNMVTATSTQ